MRYYQPASAGFSPNFVFAPVSLPPPRYQGRKLEDYSNKNLSVEFITANKFGSWPGKDSNVGIMYFTEILEENMMVMKNIWYFWDQ